jgi:hypothetical protein
VGDHLLDAVGRGSGVLKEGLEDAEDAKRRSLLSGLLHELDAPARV